MPAVLRLQVGKTERLRRGQDFFWSVMRQFHAAGEVFTVGDVWKRSDDDHRATVSTFMRRLETAGYIERVGTFGTSLAGRREPQFRIVRPQLPTPVVGRDGTGSRSGQAQQNMWNVMRRERDGWTASDLAVLASTDEVAVTRNTALAYCTRLEKAGILAVADKGCPGRPRRWWLKGSANTGPKPPMILRTKLVYDQNTARIMGDTLAEEERI